jgi:hypothetical protein
LSGVVMQKATMLKKYRRELTLALLLLITFIFGLLPSLIERFYSTGIYVFTSAILRTLLGWMPFSFGDLLYGVVFVVFIINVVKLLKLWMRKQLTKSKWFQVGRKLLRISMIIYLVFQWEWGLNYHRLGSAYQLNIVPGEYSAVELKQLADTLSSRLAVVVPKITGADSTEWNNFSAMKDRCIKDYKAASILYPFVTYRQPSVKKMIIGDIGGYGGFSGYLNPFTGEAQLNGNLPGFLRPIVTCHEIGHQLGYAAEEEANMIGYLAARHSSNPAVRYSAYHDMMTYASRELYYADSNAYHAYVKQLPQLVKQHSKQARDYYASFTNPVQTVINQWYDLYLKANSQSKGLKSYSYVTAWLIAYAKKYGWADI